MDVPTLWWRDFHRGLAERLAEVLRCREELIAQASSSSGANAAGDAPPSSSTTFCLVGHAAQLAVVELRAAEQLAFSSNTASAPMPIASASLRRPTRRSSRAQIR